MSGVDIVIVFVFCSGERREGTRENGGEGGRVHFVCISHRDIHPANATSCTVLATARENATKQKTIKEEEINIQ